MARRPQTLTRPWAPEEAVDLLTQGYDLPAVAKRTGYTTRWLSKQTVPRQSLALRAAADKRRARG